MLCCTILINSIAMNVQILPPTKTFSKFKNSFILPDIKKLILLLGECIHITHAIIHAFLQVWLCCELLQCLLYAYTIYLAHLKILSVPANINVFFCKK